MTVQVMWKIPAQGLTFQLAQQTVISSIASQSVFSKCSSFQISHLSLIILLSVKTSNVTHIFK